jgi:hypothetical protein
VQIIAMQMKSQHRPIAEGEPDVGSSATGAYDGFVDAFAHGMKLSRLIKNDHGINLPINSRQKSTSTALTMNPLRRSLRMRASVFALASLSGQSELWSWMPLRMAFAATPEHVGINVPWSFGSVFDVR